MRALGVGALALLCAVSCERVEPRAATTPPAPDAAPPARRAGPSDASTFERQMRAAIADEVKGGFAPREDIVENAVALFGDDRAAPADLETLAARLTDAALDEQRARERSWTTPTDCDRLERAFAALEARGVVVRRTSRTARPAPAP